MTAARCALIDALTDNRAPGCARMLKPPGIAAIQGEARVRAILGKLPEQPQTGLHEGF